MFSVAVVCDEASVSRISRPHQLLRGRKEEPGSQRMTFRGEVKAGDQGALQTHGLFCF